jgi:thiol-disulfide isomerase/thioredoxin
MLALSRATLLLSAALLFGSVVPDLRAQGVTTMRVEDAAAEIGQATGRPAIIVFYATTCPRSRAMFPSLIALAEQYQTAGVDFLVYSTDAEANVGRIPAFLDRHRAPFTPIHIDRWAPGDFTRAMAGVGIKAGKVWVRPLVAVRDQTGRIVAQGQGVTDLSPVAAALARKQ